MRRTEFTVKQLNDGVSYAYRSQNSTWAQKLNKVFRAAVFLVAASFWANPAQAQSCTLVCNDDGQLSLPGTTDNCEAIVSPVMVLESPLFVCNGPKTVTIFDPNGNPLPSAPLPLGHTGAVVDEQYIGLRLTVRVSDNATQNYCWGHITVADKLGPTIENCRDTTLYCLKDLRPTSLGGDVRTPTFSDCSGLATMTIVHSDAIVTGTCADPFSQIITRTWVATDKFGNASTCTQTITMVKVSLGNPAVVPSCPPNRELECNSVRSPNTNPSNTGYPRITLDGVTYDIQPGASFVCELAASYKDELFDLCGGGYKILRTWTIYDWCLPTEPGRNPFTCIQVIKVEDRRAPLIQCPPAKTEYTNSWSCAANVTLPPATVFDSCQNSTVSVVIKTPVGNINGNGGVASRVPVGIHTITYVATDDCGNQASCTMTLTVRDNTPPVAVCDKFTVVSLTNDGTAIAYANAFDDGSSDNCGVKEFKVRRMPNACQPVTTFDSYATFDCCDLGDTIMVNLRVFDDAGNYNDCMVEVWVQDKLPPVANCPADKYIDCSIHLPPANDLQAWNGLFGTGTASDNCDSVTLVQNIQKNLDQCGTGTIRRIFIATDASGFKDTCVQLITVINNDPLETSDIEWPYDYETSGCGVSVHPNDIPCTPINYCRPKIRDNNCGQIAVTFVDQLLPVSDTACYKILRKWVVIDWCQYNPNSQTQTGYWTYTQIIKVHDFDSPVLTCPGDTIYVDNLNADCSPVNVTIDPIIADDCSPYLNYTIKVDYENNGAGNFDTTYTGRNASGFYPTGTTRVHFKVEDNCGNYEVCDLIIIVRDAKKPTPVCLNGVSATLMPMNGGGMVVLTPQMFDNGSYDNCTPRSRLKMEVTPNTFTCAELGMNTVRLTVTDEAGNADFCETFVLIQDHMGVCSGNANSRIAGAVKDPNGSNVQNVKVDLSGNNTLLNSVTTGTDGMYSFGGLVPGYDYTVKPNLNAGHDNGVTTFDLVLISKHILNVQKLDSPYKIIAADVNHSGNVSTFDLVALRKVILRVATDFPNNTSWRFVDKKYIFPDPANPWAVNFPEVANVNNLGANQLATDFIAIKVGDVNGSAKTNNLLGVDDRSFEQPLVLNTTDSRFEKGELISIPFTANNFSGITGYQFTLEFDVNALELNNIEPGILDNLSEANFGLTMVNEGVITTSWDNSKTTHGKNGVLFTLQFRAKSSGKISEMLKLSSQFTKAEAYEETASGLELLDVQLEFANGASANAAFELYQNVPNPFSGQTTIGFNLPEASAATLTVFDLSGKLLHSISSNFVKGYNEVQMDGKVLPQSGVLYYRLETSTHTSTRKMVLVK